MENNFSRTDDINSTHSTTCKSCGAPMVYKPSIGAMMCTYCNSIEKIEKSENVLEELDFFKFLESYEKENFNKTKVITCTNCKATPTVNENLRSMTCPYCASPLIIENIHEERYIEPSYVLPFRIDKKENYEILKKWVDKLWFAPTDLKKSMLSINNIQGIYVPFWTFDANTFTNYKGMKGNAYYITVGSGNNKKRERRVSWSKKNGSVTNFYDDILIVGSKTLKSEILGRIKHGWNTKAIVKINPKYLEGFITEKYNLDLKEGFENAELIIQNYEKISIRKHIGGDEQRINSFNVSYDKITFKHILLPLYVCVFTYNNKKYTFYVNGLTGLFREKDPIVF